MRVRDAYFANPMAHFLHAPSQLVHRGRQPLLHSAAECPEPGARIYLCRRKDEKRRLTNEPELESALRQRDFLVLIPTDHTVTEQIARLRGASVVVGATGAGMTSVLFATPKTRVFEIQPSTFVGVWVRNLCWQLDLEWHAYFAKAPSFHAKENGENSKKSEYFDYELPLKTSWRSWTLKSTRRINRKIGRFDVNRR